jgi:hypothetical protein
LAKNEGPKWTEAEEAQYETEKNGLPAKASVIVFTTKNGQWMLNPNSGVRPSLD